VEDVQDYRSGIEDENLGQRQDSDKNHLKDESPNDDDLSEDDGEDVAFDEGDEANESEEEVDQRMQNVSFGALKQAQDAISRKRKRGSDPNADQEEKLETLRARLNEIRSKSESSSKTRRSKSDQPSSRSHKGRVQITQDDVDADSDSAPPEEESNTKSRTSKHAPASQSSRRQVTRKRTVIDVPKRHFRDPRFDALHQQSAHTGNNAKAYSFLRDYQKDEIAELKAAIKQARNEDDKETLKRKMVSMQNRIKSQEAKEREQEILRLHRREEKEKVEQGKKPFYLKSKDVKERANIEKFKGMKSKDREKLMEKRRRKEGQKEKRRMPDARRLNE
jgi:ribosomal RNA-processing protein 36